MGRTVKLLVHVLFGFALTGTCTAASLERLVMPGLVTQAHADIEEDCGQCHDLFNRAAQQQLCLDCHTHIAKDLAVAEGFHSRQADVSTFECRQCHSEHQGRSADITGLQAEVFDHVMTDFDLTGVHRTLECDVCHQPATGYYEAPSTCVGCHETDDEHHGHLGSDCAGCHDTSTWRSGQFDHASTEFPLAGAHSHTACAGCHADVQFEQIGSECIGCHLLDDTHGGARGDACGNCHSSDNWQADFDHKQQTGFALSGTHGSLACRNCHLSETDYTGMPTDCQGCHGGNDVHLGRNGSQCENCHDQQNWETGFDHLARTGFDLVEAHGSLTCTECHSGSLSDPLPSECSGCHEGDNPHGSKSADCADCHRQTSWDQAPGFHHDLSDFALSGMHRTVSCEQCHQTLAFSPLDGDCLSCHARNDLHDGAMGTACATCHNPVGWNAWMFDHGVQTAFALTGAHETMACEACHLPGNTPAGLATACVSCHRSDDVHRGGFGQNCDRCHQTDTFATPVIGG